MTKKKILFILKTREHDWGNYSQNLSSGLLNSATFVNKMLQDNGFESHLVTVKDNNHIDHQVNKYKPDVVIIEAFWVVPEKFRVLSRLHPTVQWIIRNHSELPFLSQEGMAIDWILHYIDEKNVGVASNGERATHDIRHLVHKKHPFWTKHHVMDKTPILPNFYPLDLTPPVDVFDNDKDTLNVGCFGAIRPLKNHLNQALAAIKFAKLLGKKLNFHVNASRIEGNAEPILRNLVSLFEHLPDATLVKHDWMDHKDFIHMVRKMDIGLQVSFSETFNIVAADFVANHVPIVVSKEISWVDDHFKADPTNTEEIIEKMFLCLKMVETNEFDKLNTAGLETYDDNSKKLWEKFLTF